jgi:hypothetical protein
VHTDVVVTVSGLAPGTNMSTLQTFYSGSDVIPLLSPSVDRPREFSFNPGASRRYANRQVRMEGFAVS